MTDALVEQALAELGDVVRCRCDEAFRDRGLHDPQCQCDSMDAVRVVIARIQWLERERVLDAKLLADTQGLLDKALEAVIDTKSLAEAKLAEVEAERDATTRLLAAAGDGLRLMARAEAAEAKLAEVEAERDALEVENAILRVDMTKAMKAVEAGVAALEESGRKRGETLALLDKAVDALRRIADAADRKHVGDIARAVLAEIEGGKKND